MTGRDNGSEATRLDAAIIGAGFAGLYAIRKLRDELGLEVRAFEAGSDVGGTWYWNRYPGCRCDIESYHYSYSFDPQLEQEWRWSERFAAQPEILRYLNHVADRFDLRRSIHFDTRLTAAAFDEARDEWVLTTDAGEALRARYLVSGAGCLSAPMRPAIPGVDEFAGEILMTARWPHQGVDLRGRKVGVIGTGASGIQAIPLIAADAERLVVFQRTPNYATPLGNGPLDDATDAAIKARYPEIRAASRNAFIGVPYENLQPSALAVPAAERERRYREAYEAGGFELFAGCYADLITDREANETAAAFVRERIRERVHDPRVAELLTPKDYPYGTKRPPLETRYYEAYNRPNVELVNLRADPIERIEARGVRTRDAFHELDVLVFATGFDAMTGPLLRLNPRGRGGEPLASHWADGPHTYLGLMVHGFPNLFTITGPQSPSVLYNMPLAIEDHVDFIADAIAHLESTGGRRIEATAEAEAAWTAETLAIAEQTLFVHTASWYMGANVPGKPRVFQVYIGGAPRYRQICAEVVAEGYRGFALG